jgi:flagellar biosynthesis/type III secretory pathway M-ring protein FliF/YscJ
VIETDEVPLGEGLALVRGTTLADAPDGLSDDPHATVAVLALESMEHSESDEIRDELAALVERQPEDVAALLRGWLVERH